MSKTINVADNSRVTVEKLTQSYQEVPASGTATVKLSATKAGYTPIGIVGWYVTNAVTSGYSSFVFPYILFLNTNNEAEVHFRNVHTAMAKITVEIYVLYA